MAAPQKTGLDYYPRDLNVVNDQKFVRAKIKFGYLVVVVYDALLEIIYRDKGYYMTYTDDCKENVAWDITGVLRGKYPVETDTIYEVIEMLVACRLFSHDHFKQGIITSKRIQETYYKCTVERKNVKVAKSIWMLTVPEMLALSKNSSILSIFINQSNNGDNRPNNGGNQSNNEQSKVNKTKVNKTKVNTLFDLFWSEYPRKQDKAKAKKVWEKLKIDDDLFNIIINKLKEYKQSEQWLKEKGKYIPLPTTWLNGKRWEDEVYINKTSHPHNTGNEY